MNASTSKKLHGAETGAETRVLCVITLACYSTTLAAVCALGHSLLMLALSVAGQHVVDIYSPPGL